MVEKEASNVLQTERSLKKTLSVSLARKRKSENLINTIITHRMCAEEISYSDCRNDSGK